MSKISLATGRFGLALKKNAPTIGVAGGVVGLVATVALSSYATLKAQDIVAEHKSNIAATIEAYELGHNKKNDDGTVVYSEEDLRKDQIVTWSKTAVAMFKVYGPAIIVGGLSIAAIAGGHRALSSRVGALSAAYQIADSALERYRDRVKEELGIDMEKELFAKSEVPAAAEDEAYEDDDRSKKIKKNLERHPASHSRVFDSAASPAWRPSASENLIFLKTQQNYFNNKLQSTGYVFLNEVYEALGYDRTPAGQIVGWIFTGDEGSNNFVDFGLNQGDETTKAVIQEILDPNSFFLDFNIDGVIYDSI